MHYIVLRKKEEIALVSNFVCNIKLLIYAMFEFLLKLLPKFIQ